MNRPEDKFEKQVINYIQKDRKHLCFRTKSETSALPLGFPDLMVLNQETKFIHFFELKVGNYKVSEIQKQFHEVWENTTEQPINILHNEDWKTTLQGVLG